jgi:hypothetical protein
MTTLTSLRLALRSFVALLVLAVVVVAAHPSFAQNTGQQNIGQWQRDLQADLIAEKFESLDITASHLRADKTRLPGGQWQLHLFYSALNAPQQSDQDSADHIAHLMHWMSARPDSITARVALALAVTHWAWVARGNGYSKTVTPEGWRLFHDRMDEAQAILEGAEGMPDRDPEWYVAALNVGGPQGWDLKRMNKVLEDGIQLEPGYYYLYMDYTWYLLPKWHGHAGQASEFARASADAIGGDGGDILYFQIGTTLIKLGDDEFDAHEMDWQRLQRGYQALISQFGPSAYPENQLAYMAWRFQDSDVASQQFELIGEAWNRNVWQDRNRFNRARDWAHSPTPELLPGQGVLKP